MGWKEMKVKGPNHWKLWDVRGLTCMTNFVTKISRSQDGGNVLVERSKVLKEAYDAALPDIIESNGEVVEGIGRRERERNKLGW
jgi:hypothetical protein